MNWLDLSIVLGLIWSAWAGMKRGFIRDLCHTGAALLALWLAYRFTGPWSVSLTKHFAIAPRIAQTITFGAVLFGIAALGYAFEPLLSRLTQSVRGGATFNRWAGCCAGAIKGIALTMLIVVGASQMPWHVAQRTIGESAFAIQILRAAPAIYDNVSQILPASDV